MNAMLDMTAFFIGITLSMVTAVSVYILVSLVWSREVEDDTKGGIR